MTLAEINRRKIDEFKNKSIDERRDYLLRYWKMEDKMRPDKSFMLVGSYEKSEHFDIKGQEYGYFVNIRNHFGDILYYPFGLGPVKVWVRHKPALSTKEFWLIRLDLDKGKMGEKNPFAVRLADSIFGQPNDSFKDKIEKEKFIRYIFENTGFTKIDAENEANALSRLMGDLYTETERFIFELLQNADDMPNAFKKVHTTLRILNNQLLFMHNGKPFDNDDVRSISSIGKSNKKLDSEMIGYKGIGFKSVFSDSETVFINSGSFSFSFDKESWYYRDEEDMDKVPWQIKPIWAERYRYPKEVQDDDLFFKSPVGIALTIPEERVLDYSSLIPALLKEPRFVLFLRNVASVNYSENGDNSIVIKKAIDNGICRISVNDTETNCWLTTDFVLNVDDETRDLIQNDKLVPQKLKEVKKTKITFAAQFKDGTVVPVPKEQSILFAYLPTRVDSFEFPFLINADFLTAANREDIHYKNHWNIFLFNSIGEKIVDWAIKMSESTNGYLNLLPTKELTATEQDSKYQLVTSFNDAYKKAIEEKSFIRDTTGTLRKQDEILLDTSGLSDIIGGDSFISLLKTNKHLPDPTLDVSILKKKLFDKIERAEDETVVNAVIGNLDTLTAWMSSAELEEKNKLFGWISEHSDLCKPLVNDLPILKFGDKWMSVAEASKQDDHIITATSLLPIKQILSTLGFHCSENNIDDHPLGSLVTGQKQSGIFDSITKKDLTTLSFDSRKLLFEKVKDLEGVGDEKRKGMVIFKNELGSFKSLSEMTPYDDSLPNWLNPYMVSKEESIPEVSSLAIPKDSIYASIISKNIDALCQSTSVQDIYNKYSSSWQQSLTRSLIGKVKPADLIGVINQSNDETKVLFIKSLTSVALSSSSNYSPTDYEYRLIALALSVETAIPLLRDRIVLDGLSLNSYTVKDSVTVKPTSNHICVFSLSKLDPSFTQSSIAEKMLSKFEGIANIQKLFELKEKSDGTVMTQVVKYQTEHPGLLNAEQFCFLMCYEKHYNRSYFQAYFKPIIKINDKSLFIEILQKCYDLKIPEVLSPFLSLSSVEYPYTKFTNTIFNADDYTLSSERTPEWILTWANTDEKKSFLKSLGVRDDTCNEIIRRKAFLNNTDEGNWDIKSTSTAQTFLSWVLATFDLPITESQKVDRLKPLVIYLRRSDAIKYSSSELETAKEWDDDKYIEWKNKKEYRIYLYDGEMPKKGFYPDDTKVLFKFNNGDYFYSATKKILYLNKKKEIPAVLADVYSNYSRTSGFTKDDWNELFLVKRSDVTEISVQNDELKKRNAELERALEQYRAISLPEKEREVIEKGDVDKQRQEAINREVRIKVKPYLETKGYDVSEWEPENSLPDLVGIIKDPEGNPINVVIRSANQKKIHLSASSFETLMSHPNNLLIVENHSGLHCVTFTELFGNNSNVNLVFDARHTPREYFQALGIIFKYVKNTEFVVWDPNYSAYEEIQGFGLEMKNDGTILIANLEDI